MSKKVYLFFTFLIPGFFYAGFAKAVCPVCTITVSAGVGFCRWLGIDDLISGLWVGGMIVSLIIWTLDWLNKKNFKIKFQWIWISVLFYLLTLLPLYFMGVIGHPENKFWGIDKILFSTIIGSLLFLIGVWLHKFLKNKNQGKSFFSFQKVVLPVSLLIIVSLIFHFIIGCPK